MNKFDIISILESETFNKKGIELDLSSSTISDYEKTCLKDKVEQMHCSAGYKRNIQVLMALVTADFIDLSLASKIYLSAINGNSLAEIIKKIDADSKKWESKIIINFIINDEAILKVLDELYNRIDSLSSIEQIRWGAATENDVTNKYCLEIISYS